jgi:hypothetical protein
MIKYSLRCDAGHRFDSWFANADAFDTLARAGHLACSDCGSAAIRKDIMSPRIAPGAERPTGEITPPAPVPPASAASAPKPATPPSDLPAALKALRQKIESESEYVGGAFAKEARAMQNGTSEARSIYGEAKLEDARKLIEEGISIAPLPFIPTKKAH